MTLEEWAAKWGVPVAAMQDLRTLYVPPPAETGSSEAATQSRLRVEAPKHGASLWRNNNGAYETEPGRWTRYGLGNDSKKINDVWKSSDLIGITPVTVRAEHVGTKIGVFTAVEVKHPGWKRPENDRDRAQEAFLVNVCHMGGIGMFVTHEGQYRDQITWIRGPNTGFKWIPVKL